jgi:hypothetical protein
MSLGLQRALCYEIVSEALAVHAFIGQPQHTAFPWQKGKAFQRCIPSFSRINDVPARPSLQTLESGSRR